MPNIGLSRSANSAGRGTLLSMPQQVGVNQNTGAVSVSFPLSLTQSRALTPQLSLEYHSNQGNSVFGMGFDLGGILSISRSTKRGVPTYDDTQDTFVLSTAGELVQISDLNKIKTYRPRVDSQFATIEYHTDTQCWIIREANGINHYLGEDGKSRVDDPKNEKRVFQWWVDRTEDALGNKIRYQYKKEPTTQGLSFAIAKIDYGNYTSGADEKFAFHCMFDDGSQDASQKDANGHPLWKAITAKRPDQFCHYQAGFPIVTDTLYRRIALHHCFDQEPIQDALVKYWELSYNTDPAHSDNVLSMISQVQEVGCRAMPKPESKTEPKPDVSYFTQSLPSATFQYSTLSAPANMTEFNLQNPARLPGMRGSYQWVDLYREGLPGILYNDETQAYYWRSNGKGNFAAPQPITPFPAGMETDMPTHCRIMHLGLDSKTVWVVAEDQYVNRYVLDESQLTDPSTQGYSLNFTPLPLKPYPADFANPLNEVMDLNGSGKSDFVVCTGDYPYYCSAADTAEAGYGKPQLLTLPADFPRSSLDPNALVTFVSLFGDGLLHRVKISRDGINIWPNLGYGQFAAKMHWDLPVALSALGKDFDPSCIFLADIDGSGAEDLVYAQSKQLWVFLNNGQGFTAAPNLTLDLPEAYTHQDQLFFGDLLGQGVTAAFLIKNDFGQNRYYSAAFSPAKPHLLTQMTASSGLQTTFTYDTSMSAYLQDRATQTPSTRLPFALPVLSSTTVLDPVTQLQKKIQYDYHYGDYDFRERQFCGFAYVTEDHQEGLLTPNDQTIPSPSIEDCCKRYFYYNRGTQNALQQFKPYAVSHYVADDIATARQYVTDANANPLTPTDEAQFALHGRLVREERWSGSAQSLGAAPVWVQLQNYNLRCDLAATDTAYGIYVVQPRENYHLLYQQQAGEPRVSRQYHLSFDAYNNPLAQITVEYGLSKAINNIPDHTVDSALLSKVHSEQAKTRALYHKQVYAASTGETKDFQFLHVPSEAMTYDILSQITRDSKTALPNAPTLGDPIQHSRHYYWDNPASPNSFAPLAQFKQIPLLHHQRALLGVETEVSEWYSPLLAPGEALETVLQQNGYIQDEVDKTLWWQPSLVNHYDSDGYYLVSETTQSQDGIAYPTLFHKTTITHDVYHLAVSKVTEYLTPDQSFDTTTTTDYQAMKPTTIVDHNHNSSVRVYDALGRRVRQSRFGDFAGQEIGNPVNSEDVAKVYTALKNRIDFADVMTNPAQYLGKYLQAAYYFTEQSPQAIVELSQRYYDQRATSLAHIPAADPNNPSIAIHYVDSNGQVIQTVQKTDEPDPSKAWLKSGTTLYRRNQQVLQQSLPFYSNNVSYQFSSDLDKANLLINNYDASGALLKQSFPYAGNSIANPPVSARRSERSFIITPWYRLFKDENVSARCSLPGALKVNFLDGSGNGVGFLKHTADKQLLSMTEFDVLDRPTQHQDARLAKPNLVVTYDQLGRVVNRTSVDRGQEVILHNTQNGITRHQLGAWCQRHEYDSWQRLINTAVYAPDQSLTVVETRLYGESNAQGFLSNFFGQLIKVENEEGRFERGGFDLLGNCISSTRSIFLPQLTENVTAVLSRLAPPRDVETTPSPIGFTEEHFAMGAEYDAHGNLIAEKLSDPDHSIIQYHRNRLNQVASIGVGDAAVITDMTYQASGLRGSIAFAGSGGITSQYQYDNTFAPRLKQLTHSKGQTPLWDHHYVFDRIGNITAMAHDKAPDPFTYTYDDFYRLTDYAGMEFPTAAIISDARAIPHVVGGDMLAQFGTTKPYQQHFSYDDSSNLTSIHHQGTRDWQLDFNVAQNSNRFSELTDTNTNLPIPGSDAQLYDSAGNMQKLDAKTSLQWDHTNQLSAVTTQIDLPAASTPQSDADATSGEMTDDATPQAASVAVKEFYGYRGTAFQEVPFHDTPGDQAVGPFHASFMGAKTPKINSKPFAHFGNRLYKIACFENPDHSIEVVEQLFLGHYQRKRVFSIPANTTEPITTPVLLRHSIQITDDEGETLATRHTFEVDTQNKESPSPISAAPVTQWQYHLTNHLHSASLDIDPDGTILTIEAYQAYGQIGLLIVNNPQQLRVKDYYYSSEIRDAVTGLYYYGARYYAPQFGRWIVPDPAGMIDSANLYAMVNGDPEVFFDFLGYTIAQDNLANLAQQEGSKFFDHYKKLQSGDIKKLDSALSKLASQPSFSQNVHEDKRSVFEKTVSFVKPLLKNNCTSNMNVTQFKQKHEAAYRNLFKYSDEHLHTQAALYFAYGYLTARAKAKSKLQDVDELFTKAFSLVSTFRLPTDQTCRENGRAHTTGGSNAPPPIYPSADTHQSVDLHDDRAELVYGAWTTLIQDNKLSPALRYVTAANVAADYTHNEIVQPTNTSSGIDPSSRSNAVAKRLKMPGSEYCTESRERTKKSRNEVGNLIKKQYPNAYKSTYSYKSATICFFRDSSQPRSDNDPHPMPWPGTHS